MLPNIDAGLTEDTWPLVPFQYASLVVTIKFYSRGRKQIRNRNRRQRKLQESLECRKYQKLKSDGIEVEDIWGCEQGQSGGSGPQVKYEELTLDDAEKVVLSFKAFLDSRASRSWSIKYVGLAHQKVINLLDDDNDEDDGNRRLGTTWSSEERNLQAANMEVAHLELGFRIQAEHTSSRGGDLSQVITSSITGGSESFLAGLKGLPIGAGGVEVRDILWQPEQPKKEKKDEVIVADTIDPDGATQQGDGAIDNGGGTPVGLLIGVTVGVVGLFGIVAAFLLFQRRKKKAIQEAIAANRRLTMSRTGAQRRLSVDDSKWQQGKSKLGGAVKKVALTRKDRTGRYSGSSSDEDDSWDDYDDDLSSRFYSDSSNFDPTTRAQEVGGYGDDGLEDWNSEAGTSYESGSQIYSASGSRGPRSEGDSHGTGLQSSYASGYSSNTPSVRSGSTRDSKSRRSRTSYKSGSQIYSASGSRGPRSEGDSYEAGLQSSYASGYSSHTGSVRSGSTRDSKSRRSRRSHKSSSMRSSATSGRRSGGKSNRSSRTTQAFDLQASDSYGSRTSRQWGNSSGAGEMSQASSADAYSASMDSRSAAESSQGRSKKSSSSSTRSRRTDSARARIV